MKIFESAVSFNPRGAEGFEVQDHGQTNPVDSAPSDMPPRPPNTAPEEVWAAYFKQLRSLGYMDPLDPEVDDVLGLGENKIPTLKEFFSRE